jgi:hypothetical protein
MDAIEGGSENKTFSEENSFECLACENSSSF